MENLVTYVLNMRGNLPAGLDNANSSARRLEGTIMSLGAAMGVTFGLAGIGMFINKVVQAGSVVENATIGLTTLLKDQSEAVRVIKNTMEDAMRTPFEFKGLLAANKALIAANETADGAREAVYNLANAIAATGGGNDELTRMVVNLQQIKNVGFASALDIKQFAYAGVNIYEALNKSGVKTGEGIRITYEQITKALKVAHAEGGIYFHGLENMADATSVKISNVGDAMFQAFNNIFVEIKPLVDTVLTNTISGVKTLGDGVVQLIGWIKEHKSELEFLIASYVTYKSIIFTTLGLQKLHLWYTGLSTSAIILNTLFTEGWAAAWLALNIAMKANPIGFIIAGIAALGAGVIYAWNSFEGFRSTIFSTWNVIKSFASSLWDIAKGIADIFVGIFTFDISKLSSGLTQVISAVGSAGEQMGLAWSQGQKEGALSWIGSKAKTIMPSAMSGKAGVKVGGVDGGAISSPKTKAEGQKTINIHVAYNAPLIQGFTISTTNVKEGLQSLKEQVSAILVGATHDTLMVADY